MKNFNHIYEQLNKFEKENHPKNIIEASKFIREHIKEKEHYNLLKAEEFISLIHDNFPLSKENYSHNFAFFDDFDLAHENNFKMLRFTFSLARYSRKRGKKKYYIDCWDKVKDSSITEEDLYQQSLGIRGKDVSLRQKKYKGLIKELKHLGLECSFLKVNEVGNRNKYSYVVFKIKRISTKIDIKDLIAKIKNLRETLSQDMSYEYYKELVK